MCECVCVCTMPVAWENGRSAITSIYPHVWMYSTCVCVCYLNHITNSFPASWPTFTRSGINSTINYIESNLYAHVQQLEKRFEYTTNTRTFQIKCFCTISLSISPTHTHLSFKDSICRASPPFSPLAPLKIHTSHTICVIAVALLCPCPYSTNLVKQSKLSCCPGV